MTFLWSVPHNSSISILRLAIWKDFFSCFSRTCNLESICIDNACCFVRPVPLWSHRGMQSHIRRSHIAGTIAFKFTQKTQWLPRHFSISSKAIYRNEDTQRWCLSVAIEMNFLARLGFEGRTPQVIWEMGKWVLWISGISSWPVHWVGLLLRVNIWEVVFRIWVQ